MKKILYICLLVLRLASCTQDAYFVPDNFPHEKFGSYLPYQQGDRLTFASEKDTIKMEVVESQYFYLRGRKHNNDHVKENAAKEVRMRCAGLDVTATCACLDRRRFEVKLVQKETGMSPHALGVYLFEQEKMSDQIFNKFVSTINLSDGKAQVQRSRGVMYFTDKNGVKWTYVKENNKK